MSHLLLSTWHFGQIGNDAAWPVLADRNRSALDAAEMACRAVEDAPEVLTVGRGYPDATGRVTVDGCVMLSPRWCGSVAAVSVTPYPVTLARHVMEKTPHVMLVGDGADRLARRMGMAEDDLLVPAAREAWQRWRTENPQTAANRAGEGPPAGRDPALMGHDTVGVLARKESGELAGACSTSGLAFKWPGRVGDSPIIGHGLYVDPHVGGAVATGHGELIMRTSACFLAVELMRRGESPREAAIEVVQRIAQSSEVGEKEHAALIVMAADGRYASACLRGNFQVALRSEERNELVAPDFVLLSSPSEED